MVIDRREVLMIGRASAWNGRIIKGNAVRVFTIHHTVYSGQELKDRLTAVGFHDVRLYGNIEGAPYGREADRLIAVARKPTV